MFLSTLNKYYRVIPRQRDKKIYGGLGFERIFIRRSLLHSHLKLFTLVRTSCVSSSLLQLFAQLLMLLWPITAWIPPSENIPENSCRFLAGGQRLFQLSRLLWLMCVHPLLWLFFGFNNQVSSPVTRTLQLTNSLPSLWYRSETVKAEAILCILWAPLSILGTHLVQNL
jgi:hypothetical protein